MMDFFPFDEPREAQSRVITTLERAFSERNHVLLESPVGSGKSGIGLAFARSRGRSYILTPRKSLQDQYYYDFSDHVVTLKGRSSYPCTDPRNPRVPDYPLAVIHDEIEDGHLSARFSGGLTCAKGKCLDVREMESVGQYRRICEERSGFPCPYQQALDVCLGANHIVCNLHGFIVHANFVERFEPRPAMVIDECHDMASIVRDMLIRTVHVQGKFLDETSDMDSWTARYWQTYFRHLENRPVYSGGRRDTWMEYLEAFDRLIDRLPETLGEYFVVEVSQTLTGTSFHFKPLYVGRECRSLLINQAEKVLLMSGTIFSKHLFCHEVGLTLQETAHIQVNSTFPLENRPIIYDPERATNSSAANWDNSFGPMIDNIRSILRDHPNDKGLIHTSSYDKANQVKEALGSRARTHSSEDFVLQLDDFYRTRGSEVFVSPSCQQGVDFKDDRSRFQIITSVPYLNIGDKTVSRLSQNKQWYNLRTLIVFGQQTGRVVRSEQDFGRTYLIDSRFPGFLKRNRSLIPAWLWDSFEGIV